jgi:hypothetical protein
VADFGRHPGRGDHELARPAGDRGVHVHHVGPVAQRHVGFPDSGRALRDRQALPGQLGLGHLQRGRPEQPAVSRNDPTRLDRDDIAGDQLFSGDLGHLVIAPHPGGHDQPPLKRGHSALGLALLLQAENRVSHGQQDQQKAGSQLTQGNEAQEAGHEQDDLHGVGVLADERAPARLRSACGERIGAEPAGPRRRFRRAQAVPRVYLLGSQHLPGAQRVPRGPWRRRLAFRPGHIDPAGLHGPPFPL